MNFAIFILLTAVVVLLMALIAAAFKVVFFSEEAEEYSKNIEIADKIPESIKEPSDKSSFLGIEQNLRIPIFLPDSVRSRHVHIMGATGSGKTESVLLNLIDQDAHRGHPIVILDAKGDQSFLKFLRSHPKAKDRLLVFDESSENSIRYNPLAAGSNTEAVSRLFTSMTWSEEFYKTRARETLLKLAEVKDSMKERVSLKWLSEALSTSGALASYMSDDENPVKISENEYGQLAGLVAQVKQLCHGKLGQLICGEQSEGELNLAKAITDKKIIYFRLPALVDPVTTVTLGRLLISDLSFYSAQVQAKGTEPIFTPVFLDEFGSLACHAFLELIAKARSAGMALHFSHQSLGDLKAAGDTFASQVNDNSSTKIVMRVYDPETAETVAKTFGTHHNTKSTRQVVLGAMGGQSVTGVMSVRDVREFRADPDQIKSLPTGTAFVLMNHAMRPMGASGDVFKILFPLPPVYCEKKTKESN